MALPLIVAGGRSPFEASSRPFKGRHEAEHLRPNPLTGTEQNMLIAEIYEIKYDNSMAKALTRSPKEKLVFALQAGRHVQSAILGGPELGAAASSEGGCWLRGAL